MCIMCIEDVMQYVWNTWQIGETYLPLKKNLPERLEAACGRRPQVCRPLDQIVLDDAEVANLLNKYFVESVGKLDEVNGCSQNVLSDVDNTDSNAIERFKYNPRGVPKGISNFPSNFFKNRFSFPSISPPFII